MKRILPMFRRRSKHFPWAGLGRAMVFFIAPTAACVSLCGIDNETTFRRERPLNHVIAHGVDATPLRIDSLGHDLQRVHHAFGVSVVPVQPKRLCALGLLDELVALRVCPFAASRRIEGYPDYLRDDLKNAVPIVQANGGWASNYEAILAVCPDMILSAGCDYQAYLQLSKIAPVVVLKNSGGFARERLLDVGMLLGRQGTAIKEIVRYDAKINAAREILAAKLNDRRVAFFRVFGRRFAIHGRSRAGLTLYDDLQLIPPSAISHGERGMMLNLESLLEFDADFIFLATEKTNGTTRSVQQLLSHPVWKKVPAAQGNRVVPLEYCDAWISAGLLGKSRIVDQVVQAIVPESAYKIARAVARADQNRAAAE